jgi:hypothetical protein
LSHSGQVKGKKKEKEIKKREREGNNRGVYLLSVDDLFRRKPGSMDKNRNNSQSRSYPGGGMYSKRQSGLFEARVMVFFFPRSRVWKLAQYRREERKREQLSLQSEIGSIV